MKITVLSILLLLFILGTTAQSKRTYQWYFSTNAAIDWNSGIPVANNTNVMNQYEGSSSIADDNGNLLFYTDGITVWNANHVQMPNGFGLAGDYSGTQSGLIVQQPLSSSVYYIFTNNGVSFCYSIVDMTLQSGLGDVTTKNVVLQNNVSEKNNGVKHANGTDIWVMTHEMNNNNFYAFLLTSSGVNLTPVISSVGMIHGSVYGQLKFSPDGKRCAVGIVPTSANAEVYDFDNATGIVSNPISFVDGFQTYGLGFSPNSKVLYTALHPDQEIYQYDLDAGSAADVIASKTLVFDGNGVGIVASFQLGPDKKLYFAYDGQLYIGVINEPNTLGAACDVNPMGVYLAGSINGLGLPNFIESYFQSAFTFGNTCFGDSTLFFLEDTAGLTSASWNFDDPASGSADSSSEFFPSHLFTAPGAYDVTAILVSPGGNDTVTMPVTIYTSPQPSLGSDTTICLGDSLWLDAFGGGPGYSYLWQDGTTDSMLLVTMPGTYFVSVANGTCAAKDTVIIDTILCGPSPININASDTTLCEKFCIDFFDSSSNNPTAWLWTFEGGIPITSTDQNPQQICYDDPGTFDVTLITESASGNDTLLFEDYITVFTNPLPPVITQNGNVLTSSPADSYQWQLYGVDIPGATNQSYTITQDGIYSCIITTTDGCAAVASISAAMVGIEEASNEADIFLFPNPGSLELSIGIKGYEGLLSIYLIDDLGRIFFEEEMMAYTRFEKTINTESLPAGCYHLILKNNSFTRVLKWVKVWY